jgi:hypothetical protein
MSERSGHALAGRAEEIRSDLIFLLLFVSRQKVNSPAAIERTDYLTNQKPPLLPNTFPHPPDFLGYSKAVT